MRSDTQCVTVVAPAGDVFALMADPHALPRWAVGFAQAIRADGEAWVVTTGQGAEVRLRCRTDPGWGTIDFEWSELTDGHERLRWEGPRSSDRANGGHVSLRPDGEPLIHRHPPGRTHQDAITQVSAPTRVQVGR